MTGDIGETSPAVYISYPMRHRFDTKYKLEYRVPTVAQRRMLFETELFFLGWVRRSINIISMTLERHILFAVSACHWFRLLGD